MPSSKSSFRHVIRDRKSSPEIIIVSNENTAFLNPKHLAWKITGTTEMTISIAASTGTMENIGFSSGTATVATSDVPIVLNGSDSTSSPYGFNIAETIVSKIVTANAIRAFESSLLSACDPVHQAPSPTRHSPGRHCSALMQGRSFPVQVQLFLSNHQVSNKRHLGKNRSTLSIEPFFSLARR